MGRLSPLLVLLTLLCACPGGSSGGQRAPAPCTKLGEQCELEPGKLGACSYRANCDGPSCLYCQSQH
ncbi:MAG: hypothetical protein EOO73_14820 [Myxococcales bacterium]|nr:MAG: hypothetical protein EOO73_14820 [Myxococcales bacterium]